MAITHFTFGRLASDAGSGSGPAFDIQSCVTEAKTSTSTAAATTATAPRVGSTTKAVVRVVTDTAVYVSFGTAQNASTDTVKVFMLANTEYHFYLPSAWKASVVTA